MNHVPVGVQGSIFTDDYDAYYSGLSAVELGHKIQGAIKCAISWSKSRGFKFSTPKAKAVRFTWTRQQEEIPTLFLENSILPYEGKVKYLGILLDEKLTFGLTLLK